MTEERNGLWVRTRPRGSGKYDLRLSSNPEMNPVKSNLVFGLWLVGVSSNRVETILDASDVEWLVNQMLEWLKLQEKARAENVE